MGKTKSYFVLKILKMKLFALLGLASATKVFNPQPTGGERPCEYYTMVAQANFSNGSGPAEGKLTLTQSSCKDGIHFKGTLTMTDMDGNPSNQKHGWHIHEFGETVSGCGPEYTGGHFNPYNSPSGSFLNKRKAREVGQIGNLNCVDGVCEVDFQDSVTKLHGLANIMGRAIVIHQLPENEEIGGGSGGRHACATITWAGQN